MPMTLESARVLQDGRILRLTSRGPSDQAIAAPFAGEGSVTLEGVPAEHIGTFVTRDGSAITWESQFLLPSVVAYGSGSPQVAGTASALVDGRGASLGAFSARGAVNGSQVDAGGFSTTQWTLGPGAPLLHVSWSLGDDSRNGLDPNLPLKTINRALTIARAAPPGAWVRMRRGEVHPCNGQAFPDGLDASRPCILEDYGPDAGRAVLQSGHKQDNAGNYLFGTPGTPSVAINQARTPFKHLAIRRVEVRTLVPGTDGGIRVANSPTNYVLDDVVIRECSGNTGIQGNDAAPGVGALINRCILLDAWSSTGAHAQGFYGQSIADLLISQCTLDHNGWAHGAGDTRDIFKHNIYLNANLKGPVIWGNVVTRGSSHGMQARGGGVVAYNYFGANAIAGFIGTGGGSLYKNVCEKADDINPVFVRAQGFSTNGSSASLVHGNVVANSLAGSPYPTTFFMEGAAAGYSDTRITGNAFADAGGVGLMPGAGRVTFRGNRAINRTSPAVTLYPAPSSWAWLDGDNNAYGPAGVSLFTFGNSRASLPAWQAASGQDAGSTADVSGGVGYTLPDATLEAFRDRGPGEWGPEFSTQTIHAAFLASVGSTLPDPGDVPTDPTPTPTPGGATAPRITPAQLVRPNTAAWRRAGRRI